MQSQFYSPFVVLKALSDSDRGIDGLRVHWCLRKRLPGAVHLSKRRTGIQERRGHQHAAFWGTSVIHVVLVELWRPLWEWRNILLGLRGWECVSHRAIEVRAELRWWRASVCHGGA